MWRRSEKWRLSENSGQEMPSALWPHLHSRSCFVVSGARAAHPTAAGPLAPLCRLPHVILGHSWCSGRLWGPEAAGAGVGRRMASSPADRAAPVPPPRALSALPHVQGQSQPVAGYGDVAGAHIQGAPGVLKITAVLCPGCFKVRRLDPCSSCPVPGGSPRRRKQCQLALGTAPSAQQPEAGRRARAALALLRRGSVPRSGCLGFLGGRSVASIPMLRKRNRKEGGQRIEILESLTASGE